jgi:gliding motility-associated lipoprotein GldH
MKKYIIPFLAVLFVFTACSHRKIYEKYLDNERITWNRFDVKTFKVDIKDISSKYAFYVALRHVTDVPINYINISFSINTSSGETRTIEQKILLRDNDGKLLGNGMGDLWDVVQLVRDNFEFTEPGICTVEISSRMPQANLPGVMQVGLIVKKSR